MTVQTIQEVVRARIQDASEAARETFRDAVRPIYGINHKGAAEHIGSALLLALPEGHFLLTAAHVIDWNKSTTLYGGMNTFVPLKFEALITSAPKGNRKEDHADFAMALLNADLVSNISGVKFITEEEISRSVASGESRIYTCLGYPNSRNKVNPYKTTKVAPTLGRYTGIGRSASLLPIANDHDHILVGHDAKFSLDESGAQVRSIALSGFSGGAIVDVGRISMETLDAKPDPKLAALLIEGYAQQKVILGTRLTTILDAVRKHLQNDAHCVGDTQSFRGRTGSTRNSTPSA